MKTITILIASIAIACAEDSYFSGTSQNLSTGDIVYTYGYTEHPTPPYQPQIDFLQRDTARLRAEIASMEAEDRADRQLSELQEQTELLRKIANE